MKTAVYIAILLINMACSVGKPEVMKTHCTLTITLDSAFDYDLLDITVLQGDQFKSSIAWIYDTMTKTTSYHWDTLALGNYVFKIKTIFHKEQILFLSLSNDTGIHIKDEFGFRLSGLIDKSTLKQSDTVEFVYTSNGCFHNYWEKSILVKDKSDNTYKLKTRSNIIMRGAEPIHISKKVSSDIIDTLFQLQFKSKNLQDLSGNYYCSTTTNSLYILANNQVFKFNDQGIKNWDLYEKFKANYINN